MVYDHNPKSTAKIAGHPIHPMLIPFPIALFVSTFVTDLVFWRSGSPGWANASVYLLGGGLIMAALAAVAGLTDFLGSSEVRHMKAAVQHMIGNVIAVLLEVVNLVARLRGGDDAIIPLGLLLSTVVVGILLFTGWKGWEMVYRGHVGVSDEPTHLAHR
jgi:uncharacterized membrane protein